MTDDVFAMENGFGIVIEIHVKKDGTADIKFDEIDELIKTFPSEDAAYDWAYRKGFRE